MCYIEYIIVFILYPKVATEKLLTAVCMSRNSKMLMCAAGFSFSQFPLQTHITGHADFIACVIKVKQKLCICTSYILYILKLCLLIIDAFKVADGRRLASEQPQDRRGST